MAATTKPSDAPLSVTATFAEPDAGFTSRHISARTWEFASRRAATRVSAVPPKVACETCREPVQSNSDTETSNTRLVPLTVACDTLALLVLALVTVVVAPTAIACAAVRPSVLRSE